MAGIPSNITVSTLTPETTPAATSPIVGTSPALRGGARLIPPVITSVTGTFAEGATLTILADNLSTETAAPVLFENFDQLAVGASPTTVNGALSTDGFYVGDDDRPKFGAVFATDNAIQRNLDKIWLDLGGSFRQEIYTEVWLRVNVTDFTNTVDQPQIKYPRLTPADVNGNAQNTTPIFTSTRLAVDTDVAMTYRPLVIGESSSYYYALPPNDTWFKLVQYMRFNTSNMPNGERLIKTSNAQAGHDSDNVVGHFASPTGAVSADKWYGEQVEFDLSDMAKSEFRSYDSPGFRSYIATPYFQRPEQSTVVSLARVHVNSNYERVEIGDAPTWDACDQYKTYTVPTLTRASGEITVELDSLAPLSGDSVYVYVFNRDGRCNANGYLIS